MICPSCGGTLVEGSKYCGDCGSSLPWRCGACGGENPPDKRFCSQCGATVMQDVRGGVAAARSRSAERRQLTTVFIDLVGSTALGERLDPEDLREVIAAYHHCAAGLVVRHGGFVARYMGDGLLAYFGYPHADENDAERAVRSGLAIVKAISLVGTVAGPPGTLKARVGIATGLTVVGDLIGSGSALETAVVGDTPNLAARLQALAEPNAIVISDTTRRLTRSPFEYQDLGLVSLRGLSEPVHAWSVLGETSIENGFEAHYLIQVPLVGREEELALLTRRWNQAERGEGRAVLLSGDPGIGKSRLIAALEQSLSSKPHERLRFSCSPHYQDTPLHPIIRRLGRDAGFLSNDTPSTKLEKLRQLLGSGAPDVDVILIAELLSLDVLDGSLTQPTPRQRKELTLEAINRYLVSRTRHCPLLLVLEDIHWADATTRELFALQIENVERLPMLLVITTRPDMQPSWATDPQVSVQILGALHRRQATSLIESIAGPRFLPDHVVERIIAHADGVPLFIEELTKTVLERKSLANDADLSSPKQSLSAEIVPTSLQASLMARLDRAASSKEVAQIGAVIGRDFSFETLSALCSAEEKQLEEALDRLLRSGLIARRGRVPHAVYSFKHALVQDAAYASLLRDKRRDLHRRLADVLEKRAVDDAATEPQLIAWHFGEAGAPSKSIDYYLKAVERATGRFALREMLGSLRKALSQLELLPESVDKQRRELDLLLRLGQVLIDLQGSGSEDVRETFERAKKLCLALGDTTHLLVVFEGLVLNYHFSHSSSRKMQEHADELSAIAQRTGDDAAHLWSLRMHSSANLLQGRLEDARRGMQRVIDMYRCVVFDDKRMARDPRVSTRINLGICLTTMGYLDSGRAMSLDGIVHAETTAHTGSLIASLRRACIRSMLQRDAQAVLSFSERLILLNQEHETFVGTQEGIIFQGWVELRANRNAEPLERTIRSLEQLDEARHWVMLPFFITSVAEAVGELGDRAGALALLERATQIVKLTEERWAEPELIRVEACCKSEFANETVGLLHASLAKAQGQSAKLWELRTATDLAEIRLSEGKLTIAREVLEPVYAWFTEGLDSPDLVAARGLLERLGQLLPRSEARRGGVTDFEARSIQEY